VAAVTLTAALTLEHLSKVFEGQRALDDVSLEVRAGEVHALLGQNGSGKSTLIKVLSGYHQPEPGGTASLRGEPFELGSAAAARAGGLRFIHQDHGLVGALDAVDNLALGAGYHGRWWLADRRERRAAERVLRQYGVEIDVTVPVQALTPAQQGMVAIAKALHGLGDEGVLVLDEATAALPAEEVRELFRLLRTLRERGVTIVYVTHRLNEVFELADRVTVLRDGRRVGTYRVADLDHDALVEAIIGRPLESAYPELPAPASDVVLELAGLSGDGVEDLSLQVRRGEVVGVTGLVGSGYESVASLAFGAVERDAGEVRVGGEPVGATPQAAIAGGLAFAPADRRRFGAIPTWTVRENLTLPALRSRWLSGRRERAEAVTWINSVKLSPPNPELLFSALSGGNQQKVVIARWLRCHPRAYLFDEPTNGVDVGAKRAIYEEVARVAADGAAVLISSADAEELCAVSDRVAVFRDGRIARTLVGDDVTVTNVRAATMSSGARSGHGKEI
jgi:ribose transport system ATP-binding protein